MKKVIVLDTALHRDYRLIGISSHYKDYRLTWHLNDQLKIELRKIQDFRFEKPGSLPRNYGLYLYEDELHRVAHYLLSNRSEGALIFEKWAHINYILMLCGDGSRSAAPEYVRRIREVPNVLHAGMLDPVSERNFSLVASGLELMMLQTA